MAAKVDEEGAAPGGSETVQLLVGHDRNRQLLTEYLGDRYEVTTGRAGVDADVDLVVADAAGRDAAREVMRRHGGAGDGSFLPLLLVVDDRDDRDPRDAWAAVDEVVETPVNPGTLLGRVRNLLRLRTQSLRLQRRARESEDRFESLFDATPDPTVVVREDGEVAAANEAFCRCLDLDPDGVEGATVSELAERDAETGRILVAVAEAEPGDTERQVEWTSDGEALVTDLNVAVVDDLADATERVGVFRDVTARERREAELERQNERLEGFADTLAHDLRNPLGIARGSLEMARETGDDEHFEAVADSLDRMEELVENMLTLAKEGQHVIDPEPVELSAVATEAWENVRTKEATLRMDGDRELLADRERLVQLLENLIRNAVEHAGPAPVVTVRATDEGFAVADDGTGIPQHDAEMAFEAGYTTDDDGTGFGLRIVEEIARGHTWSVAVTDGEDGGARFEFTGVESP